MPFDFKKLFQDKIYYNGILKIKPSDLVQVISFISTISSYGLRFKKTRHKSMNKLDSRGLTINEVVFRFCSQHGIELYIYINQSSVLLLPEKKHFFLNQHTIFFKWQSHSQYLNNTPTSTVDLLVEMCASLDHLKRKTR